MLVGHGRELVLFSLPHPLVRVLFDDLVYLQVTGRGYYAQDHESVPHKSIRRAPIEEIRELHEAEEVKGLCGGLEIEEPCAARPWMGPRRWEHLPKDRLASRCAGSRPARRAYAVL